MALSYLLQWPVGCYSGLVAVGGVLGDGPCGRDDAGN